MKECLANLHGLQKQQLQQVLLLEWDQYKRLQAGEEKEKLKNFKKQAKQAFAVLHSVHICS